MRVEDALERAGLGGLEFHAYALQRADELPAKGGSEAQSKERPLRIAACTLLVASPRASEHPPSRSVDEVYEHDLIEPLRVFFGTVESVTGGYSFDEINALVEYAGA